jgi:hypothetical protein
MAPAGKSTGMSLQIHNETGRGSQADAETIRQLLTREFLEDRPRPILAASPRPAAVAWSPRQAVASSRRPMAATVEVASSPRPMAATAAANLLTVATAAAAMAAAMDITLVGITIMAIVIIGGMRSTTITNPEKEFQHGNPHRH